MIRPRNRMTEAPKTEVLSRLLVALAGFFVWLTFDSDWQCQVYEHLLAAKLLFQFLQDGWIFQFVF